MKIILGTDHIEKVSHQCGFFYEFENRYFVKMTFDIEHKENVFLYSRVQ